MKLFKRTALLAVPLAMVMGAGSVYADDWAITVTNLTNGNSFTPLLLTATPHDTHLFTPGTMASSELALMAECGDISGLVGTALVTSSNSQNPAGGLLKAGMSTTTTIANIDQAVNTHLSVVAMILPTNDAFIGLDSAHIETFDAAAASNTHTFFLMGYDAGSETNDELFSAGCALGQAGMPMAELAGTDTGGDSTTAEDISKTVHVHRGVLGDAVNDSAGSSDLNSTVHRWQNPVAKVTVVVTASAP